MVAESVKARVKDTSLWKEASLINGDWVSTGERFDVTNPATGEVIGSVPDHGKAETQQAIDAAAEAFKTWKKTTTKARHDILKKFFDLVTEKTDELGAMITLENGKTFTEGKGEVTYSAGFLEWFAEEAVRDEGDVISTPVPGNRNLVIKQPIGVVACLVPWNFPAAMITRKIAPALAAGCTVVIKPSPETPFTTLALAELASRAGVPKGVINVVCTNKHTKDVGLELTSNPIVKKVTFTGSTPVGRLLMQQAGSTIKKCSFELGGLAPFIVFEDADIEKAVDAAIVCKLRGTGQTCVCANLLFVHSSVYDKFSKRLVEKVSKLKVGDGFEEGVTHGPLIHDAAVQKCEKHVQDAVSKGAKVLIGGKRPKIAGGEKGSFFELTVLGDAQQCLINEEETFGPVAALYKFETEEEVLKRANAPEVGLAGYFFSENLSRIFRVAEALEVGMVGVNTGIVSNPLLPFGGVKQSGLGREGSKYGLQEYTEIKLIVIGGMDV